jgi:hypothetical protein
VRHSAPPLAAVDELRSGLGGVPESVERCYRVSPPPGIVTSFYPLTAHSRLSSLLENTNTATAKKSLGL